jgi:hypothetical protein
LSIQINLALDFRETPSKDKLTVLETEVEFLKVNLIKNIRPTNAGCSKDIVIDNLLPSVLLSNQFDTLHCRNMDTFSLVSFQRTQTDDSETMRCSEASKLSRRRPMNEWASEGAKITGNCNGGWVTTWGEGLGLSSVDPKTPCQITLWDNEDNRMSWIAIEREAWTLLIWTDRYCLEPTHKTVDRTNLKIHVSHVTRAKPSLFNKGLRLTGGLRLEGLCTWLS